MIPARFSLLDRLASISDSARLLRFEKMENVEAANQRAAKSKQRRDQLTYRALFDLPSKSSEHETAER